MLKILDASEEQCRMLRLLKKNYTGKNNELCMYCQE
jgi:hypothetical protein